MNYFKGMISFHHRHIKINSLDIRVVFTEFSEYASNDGIVVC